MRPALNVFKKKPIPETLPASMQKLIDELAEYKDQIQCLRRAYYMVTDRYEGYRFHTWPLMPMALNQNVDFIWNRRGKFIHCNTMNYLVRIFLVRSGLFSDDDIELRWTAVWWLSPHQYLHVRIDGDRYVDIDPWGRYNGIALGHYGHGFFKTPNYFIEPFECSTDS